MASLTIQPAAAAGKDTYILSTNATTNFGTGTTLRIGADVTAVHRSLIQFDLSPLPAGSTILSAVLSLYANVDNSSNTRTFRVFRLKQAWTEAGATWNKYDGTSDWQTAGGFGANDCEQTDIGSLAFTDTETLNVFKDFTLTASAIQEMLTSGIFTNNGFLVKADTEASDNYRFASSDDSTAANRPKLTLTYTPPAAGHSVGAGVGNGVGSGVS